MGLDMLENPERRMEARLARDSKEYTIAGPFELSRAEPECCSSIRSIL